MPEPTRLGAARARGERALLLALVLAVLFAYGRAAAPDVIAEGDCGEYVAAAHVAGVPHQPGFPAYMLLAVGVAACVPAEGLARALNLTSAVFGALTVGLVALVALRLARRAHPGASPWAARGAGVVAALVLAGATEFWNQALGAEVYAPSAFLLALFLERWTAELEPRRRWPFAAGLAGLAFGFHYNVGVPCALLAAAGVAREWRALGRRGLARVAAAFALGLAPFLYLPLRSLADPALDFGDPETPGRFLRALTLADMPTGKVVARELALLGGQVRAVVGLAADQWPGWVALLLFAGLGTCILRRRLHGILAALAGTVGVVYAGILANANFALVPEEIYELRFLFLPAYVAFALLAGLGAGGLAALADELRAAPLIAGIVAVALAPWLFAQAQRLDKHDDRVFREYGEALLAVPPGPAILFTFGDNAWMPVVYLQTVHGMRPDVSLIAAGLLRHAWYREQLRARFPALVLDEAAPGVAGIARANAGRIELYHADPEPRGVPGFQEVPCGVLRRLVPSGERADPRVPPAPAFTPPYAALDRRERSVRADVVQAYVRTGRWCRSQGYLRQAEEAFRQGLALVPPAPPMQEFQLARAGLWLELGDLEAARGRLDAARAAWTSARADAPESAPAELAAKRLLSFPAPPPETDRPPP